MSSIFADIQPAVRKETRHVAIGTGICVVLMWVVFAILHAVTPEQMVELIDELRKECCFSFCGESQQSLPRASSLRQVFSHCFSRILSLRPWESWGRKNSHLQRNKGNFQ